jgi:hypothetical protein
MAAAGERAGPLQPRLPKVRAHQQLGGLVRVACIHLAPGVRRPGRGLERRAAWQPAHISTVNRPSTSRNGPVEAPQKEQRGPTPPPFYPNYCSMRLGQEVRGCNRPTRLG